VVVSKKDKSESLRLRSERGDMWEKREKRAKKGILGTNWAGKGKQTIG